MEYPRPPARDHLILSLTSRIATLSSTCCQWSTPLRDHRTFSLTSPHPASQLCLRHSVNGVPPCAIIEHSPSRRLIPCCNFVFDIMPMEYLHVISFHLLTFYFPSLPFISSLLTLITFFSPCSYLSPAHCPRYFFTYSFHFTLSILYLSYTTSCHPHPFA
jgi:hypothetical protein